MVTEYGVPDDDPRWWTLLDNALAYLQQNNDVILGGADWSAGPWWGVYRLSVEPTGTWPNVTDRPLMPTLAGRATCSTTCTGHLQRRAGGQHLLRLRPLPGLPGHRRRLSLRRAGRTLPRHVLPPRHQRHPRPGHQDRLRIGGLRRRRAEHPADLRGCAAEQHLLAVDRAAGGPGRHRRLPLRRRRSSRASRRATAPTSAPATTSRAASSPRSPAARRAGPRRRPAQTFEDVPPGSTFYLYVERMAGRGHHRRLPLRRRGRAVYRPGQPPLLPPGQPGHPRSDEQESPLPPSSPAARPGSSDSAAEPAGGALSSGRRESAALSPIRVWPRRAAPTGASLQTPAIDL